jgi:beta-1,4-mannosyltransferase
MQYHALALASRGSLVDVVGYVETPLPAVLAANPGITVHALSGRSQPGHRGVRWWLSAATRGLGLTGELAAILLRRVPRPDVVLVQNPPGIPTLGLAWMAARARGARLVIDWHNLTGAMLALRLGHRHWAVRAAFAYEAFCGRLADGNLFVSSAMKEALARRWSLGGVVVHDQPAMRFRVLAPAERAAERARVCARLSLPWAPDAFDLVVTATSWTDDEDFALLLDAVERCESTRAARSASQEQRPLLIVLTGSGPRRVAVEQALAGRRSGWVHLRTAWFEEEEYPRVVGASDAGLSLHRSASGLDLPMKVLDYLGAGVPVCALDYGACLGELVRAGENGFLFSDSRQLADLLVRLFVDVEGVRERLRVEQHVREARRESWEEAWGKSAGPLLLEVPRRREPGWNRAGH